MKVYTSFGSVLLAVAVLTGCSSSQQTPSADPNASEARPASNDAQSQADFALRAESYETLEELMADSSLVVVGVPGDESPSMLREYGDESLPLGTIWFRVEQGIIGKYAGGESVQVAVESRLGDDGELVSDKLQPGAKYMLFLTSIGERAPDVYAVTGYMAGVYLGSDSDDFVRQDAESDELPAVLRVADVEALDSTGSVED